MLEEDKQHMARGTRCLAKHALCEKHGIELAAVNAQGALLK